MTQIKQIHKVPNAPRTPGDPVPDLPKVLGEIAEWQAGGKLGQLVNGRYYAAISKHTNSHKDNHSDYERANGSHCDNGGTSIHSDSHTDIERANGSHTDHGERAPHPPRDPNEHKCIGRKCD